MKQRNKAILAVTAVAVLLCTGFTYLAYPQDEGYEPFGSPWANTNVEGNLMSERPALNDDFYASVNYDWLSAADPGPNNPSVSPKNQLKAESDADLIDLIVSGRPTVEWEIVRALWDRVVDTEARESAGIEPVSEYIDMIVSADTTEELADILPKVNIFGVVWKMSYLLSEDVRNVADAECRSIYGSPVLGTNAEEGFVSILADLLEMFGLGSDDALEVAKTAVNVDYELWHIAVENPAKIDRGYDGAFPMWDMAVAMGFPENGSFTTSQEWLDRVNAMIVDDPRSLSCFVLASFAVSVAPLLNEEAWGHYSAIRELARESVWEYGSEESALGLCKIMIPTAVAGLYSDFIVSGETRSEVEAMARDALTHYKIMLESSDLFDRATLTGALKKLDSMKIIVAESTWGRDFSTLDRDAEGLFGMSASYHAFDTGLMFGEIGMPSGPEPMVARSIWEVNAAYSPYYNCMVVLGPFLYEPMYDKDRSLEENMAWIGFIICHEISHAFDPSGGMFDEEGRVNDWWSPEVREEYDRRVDRLNEAIMEIEAFPGKKLGKVYGHETVADLCAMDCLLSIASGIDGFDYRLFFESFAESWARVLTPQEAHVRFIYDLHLPDYLRVNFILQQFGEFHDTYGVTEGNGMWLAPEDRILIW